MKDKILENIDNPKQLEACYRGDKSAFKNAFFDVYPEIAAHRVADFWKTRLEFEGALAETGIIRRKDLLFLIFTCVIAGLLIQIPKIFSLSQDDSFFYLRNAGLIVFFGLTLFAFLVNKAARLHHVVITSLVFVVAAVYINLLPANIESQSVRLAMIHLPLVLWCLYGLVFINFDTYNKQKRLNYIKHNGDLAILIAIIAVAGGILTGLTIAMFSAIGLNIEQFYFDYIVVWALVAAPIVATFISRTYPAIANKIAPVIASIFSPLVFITLLVFLVSIAITGKNPYHDRDFLILFNLVLVGVMAIVVFSISNTLNKNEHRFHAIMLLALTSITLIIDLIALSAIVFRIGEYGITPNKTVVLGSNLLILINITLIIRDLYSAGFKNNGIQRVENTITGYLPIYFLWAIFVVFGIPLLFGLA
jgi:hypothetical protein